MARRGGGPTRTHERRLLQGGHAFVAGIDEVGRGAWAGPVVVGVVVTDETSRRPPAGINDSKLLNPRSRTERSAQIRRWCAAWGIGMASADEVDDVGLTVALGRAAVRALRGLPVAPTALLLDGAHDYVTGALREAQDDLPTVTTLVGGDRRSTSVAAASIVAKVERDALMVRTDETHPGYGFAQHKGYCTPAHRAAVASLGLSSIHRSSWRWDPSDREQDGDAIGTVLVD